MAGSEAAHHGVLTYYERSPPLACLAVAALKGLSVQTAPDAKRPKDLPPTLQIASGKVYTGTEIIVRYLARLQKDPKHNEGLYLYGHDAESSTEVDEWLAFSPSLAAGPGLADAAAAVNDFLSLRTHLVGHRLTLADVALWGQLTGNLMFAKLRKGSGWDHLERWLDGLAAHKILAEVAASHAPKGRAAKAEEKSALGRGGGDTGSFIGLKDAMKGKVVTRFPPEPSGYLHIGHAKAAMLNQYFKEVYDGKLLVRFDDTNPSKEKDEFVENIVKDIKALGLQHQPITYTSDYFDEIKDLTIKLIDAGYIYADDTSAAEITAMRRALKQYKDRNTQPAARTKEIFQQMLSGSEEGARWCLRARINLEGEKTPARVDADGNAIKEADGTLKMRPAQPMEYANGAMRDPVVFRCNPQHHWRTGNKWKAYPTYDLACPYVDAREGVTHALRSLEYSDREPQFYWFLDAIRKVEPKLPHVNLWHFSRMSFVNTVLSKRKLTQLVDAGKVDGWADPRMPTVQGIFRRGLQLAALREFIISQGSSRNTNLLEWDKLWTINKKIIDPVAPRHTAVATSPSPVRLTIEEAPAQPQRVEGVPKHKKNPDIGKKTVILASTVLLDAADADAIAADWADADAGSAAGKPLSEAEAAKRRHVTLMDWGSQPVVQITDVTREGDRVTALRGRLAPSKGATDTNLKLTWLADVDDNKVPLQLVQLGPLIRVKQPQPDDEIFTLFNEESKSVSEAYGDLNMRSLAKGDVIQLERKGYWIVDVAPDPKAPQQPLVLLDIPDGRIAKSPATAAPAASSQAAKPAKAGKAGKQGKPAAASILSAAAPAAANGASQPAAASIPAAVGTAANDLAAAAAAASAPAPQSDAAAPDGGGLTDAMSSVHITAEAPAAADTAARGAISGDSAAGDGAIAFAGSSAGDALASGADIVASPEAESAAALPGSHPVQVSPLSSPMKPT